MNTIKGLLKHNNTFFVRYSYKVAVIIYHRIQNICYSIAPMAYVLDYKKKLLTQKKENLALMSISKKGYEILDIEPVYQRFRHRKNDICHIIGGGWSLNLSKNKIKSGDFVIGMNYSALVDLKFDVYFVEQGICDDEETRIRIKFIDDVVSKQADVIYYKNAWGYHDIEYVIKNYAKRVQFIKSYPLFCSNIRNANKMLNTFLKYDPVYLKQYRSTVISSIAFAKNIGFKKIVLHGMDFGGLYFYEEKEPEGKRQYIPPKSSLSVGKQKHQTVLNACGVDIMLPIINKLLQRENVNLFTGSLKSPSSKYLNVYESN